MSSSGEQLYLFSPVSIQHRGDGSYLVKVEKPQQWMLTRDAARLCGVSQDTIARWSKDGLIEARRMGPRRFQVNVDSLKKYLESYNHLK
ncbi:MAG: excisionase family DNA-binding protein [Opitutales bacterium]|nr:excisionase family DNA-binding protein [Opitutales bacterium]